MCAVYVVRDCWRCLVAVCVAPLASPWGATQPVFYVSFFFVSRQEPSPLFDWIAEEGGGEAFLWNRLSVPQFLVCGCFLFGDHACSVFVRSFIFPSLMSPSFSILSLAGCLFFPPLSLLPPSPLLQGVSCPSCYELSVGIQHLPYAFYPHAHDRCTSPTSSYLNLISQARFYQMEA